MFPAIQRIPRGVATIFALCVFAIQLRGSSVLNAEEFNYDEAKVPPYTLPELLKCEDGTLVDSPEVWNTKRRPEILRLFEEHVFGTLPAGKIPLRTKIRSSVPDALEGRALRREVTVYFSDDDHGPQMDLLIYTPAGAREPVPAFMGYNFNGNHMLEKDPRIHLTESWVLNRKELGIEDHKARESSRGGSASRWSVPEIVSRGYGLITIYYGDVDPDIDDGFKNGIHALFEKGDAPRAANAGGSISAWAWGLSRALDVLESDSTIDAKKVAVFGHSRLGKTSLWTGATDQRFAMVIANESGCGGAALDKRIFGETVHRINTAFPHWFCINHRKYNNNEAEMPVDNHMLIALSAPRPVYVASAEEDRWADPYGEYLSLYHAGPAFQLFGKTVLESDRMPAVNTPVHADVGYHIRTGAHDVTEYDWQQYLKFADAHLGNRK
ncbi:MAG: acetylxylan esterase [Planctomycetaceae bacterium]